MTPQTRTAPIIFLENPSLLKQGSRLHSSRKDYENNSENIILCNRNEILQETNSLTILHANDVNNYIPFSTINSQAIDVM